MRRKRDAALKCALRLLAAVLVLIGMFARVGMLSRLSRQNKLVSGLEDEIRRLDAGAESLELSINQSYNLENIAERARQLGMVQPDESQIRVIRVIRSDAENTSAQSVGVSGGEKVLN